MFSGKRMWTYLFGSFVNALLCSFVPIMVMQSTQSISGGGFSLFVSRVGHPIELWGMGFSLWTDIILSIIVMGAIMVPKWNWNFVTFFFLALLFFVSSVQWSYF